MKLIRCQKCGTVVISEETFLQNIMERYSAASCKSAFFSEFRVICAAGEEKAKIRRDAEDKELNAIYGCYETVCNRTMPSPTEKAAMRRCR